jgi:hypothetical protein
MEIPVLGRELMSRGLISIVSSSGRRYCTGTGFENVVRKKAALKNVYTIYCIYYTVFITKSERE